MYFELFSLKLQFSFLQLVSINILLIHQNLIPNRKFSKVRQKITSIQYRNKMDSSVNQSVFKSIPFTQSNLQSQAHSTQDLSQSLNMLASQPHRIQQQNNTIKTRSKLLFGALDIIRSSLKQFLQREKQIIKEKNYAKDNGQGQYLAKIQNFDNTIQSIKDGLETYSTVNKNLERDLYDFLKQLTQLEMSNDKFIHIMEQKINGFPKNPGMLDRWKYKFSEQRQYYYKYLLLKFQETNPSIKYQRQQVYKLIYQLCYLSQGHTYLNLTNDLKQCRFQLNQKSNKISSLQAQLKFIKNQLNILNQENSKKQQRIISFEQLVDKQVKTILQKDQNILELNDVIKQKQEQYVQEINSFTQFVQKLNQNPKIDNVKKLKQQLSQEIQKVNDYMESKPEITLEQIKYQLLTSKQTVFQTYNHSLLNLCKAFSQNFQHIQNLALQIQNKENQLSALKQKYSRFQNIIYFYQNTSKKEQLQAQVQQLKKQIKQMQKKIVEVQREHITSQMRRISQVFQYFRKKQNNIQQKLKIASKIMKVELNNSSQICIEGDFNRVVKQIQHFELTIQQKQKIIAKNNNQLAQKQKQIEILKSQTQILSLNIDTKSKKVNGLLIIEEDLSKRIQQLKITCNQKQNLISQCKTSFNKIKEIINQSYQNLQIKQSAQKELILDSQEINQEILQKIRLQVQDYASRTRAKIESMKASLQAVIESQKKTISNLNNRNIQNCKRINELTSQKQQNLEPLIQQLKQKNLQLTEQFKTIQQVKTLLGLGKATTSGNDLAKSEDFSIGRSPKQNQYYQVKTPYSPRNITTKSSTPPGCRDSIFELQQTPSLGKDQMSASLYQKSPQERGGQFRQSISPIGSHKSVSFKKTNESADFYVYDKRKVESNIFQIGHQQDIQFLKQADRNSKIENKTKEVELTFSQILQQAHQQNQIDSDKLVQKAQSSQQKI